MTELSQVIARYISLAMLERIVIDQGVVDDGVRTTLFKSPDLSALDVAERLVAAYGSRTDLLAYALYDQVARYDFGAGQALAPHFRAQPGRGYTNHEASFVARFPTIPADDLDQFLSAVKRRVCLIVSRVGTTGRAIRGTGFLVAPSYVLTCRHVLPWPLPPTQLPHGTAVEIYFDFLHGAPIEQIGAARPMARKVALAKNWRVASSESAVPDGLEGVLTPEQSAVISTSLDFMLLRLAEPVGRQPARRGGGQRRGWIHLPPAAIPQGLAFDDPIIIPQHPGGFPLQIDIGRFREPDQTATRIRYRVNAARGSSGAPCFTRFDEKFQLVGVHNAYVGPEHDPSANQAVRLDRIAEIIAGDPEISLSDDSAVTRWSLSRDDEPPNVIIGRDILLDWLRKSANPQATELAHRVYAAQADAPKSGCTFAVDVLAAETRDSKSPRPIYGQRGQLLPSSAEDFLRSLLRELGIADPTVMESIPRRPGLGDGVGAVPVMVGEVDKLERWLSDELPAWLGRVLNAHVERVVDVRVAARTAVESYTQQSLEPPAELKEFAEAADAILVRPHAWDVAYIVVDDLRSHRYPAGGVRTEMTAEITSLLAGLVRGRPADPRGGLRRLRWMFLGYLPDFVLGNDGDHGGATREVLSPGTLGPADVLSVFQRISNACFPMENVVGLQTLAELVVEISDRVPSGEPRLVVLQHWANQQTAKLLKEMGS